MSGLCTAVFFILLSLCVLINGIGLPGNWLAAAIAAASALLCSGKSIPASFYAGVVLLLLAGEGVEFMAQIWGSKKFGSSKASYLAGIAGAFAGAILGMPLLFGLGAMLGALAGAWSGCFLTEIFLMQTPFRKAWHAANGALIGRLLGLCAKFGAGAGIILLSWHYF